MIQCAGAAAVPRGIGLVRVLPAAVLAAWLGTVGGALAETEPTPLHRQPAPPLLTEPAPPNGFTFEPVAAPDGHGIGVLDDKGGGLGVDLWTGSPRALVARLLPDLPARTSSPTLRSLMRRLLLTSAAAPAGSEDIIHPRVERLWAMGEVDGVLDLINALPGEMIDGRLRRFRTDAQLLAGNFEAVCGQPAAEAADDADGYFSQVGSFCDVIHGRGAQAALTAAWLREKGQGEPAFFAALETLVGGPRDIASLPQPRPLDLVMMRAARMALPADASATTDLVLLRFIVADETAPLELRLTAAEKLDAAGAMESWRLRDLYSAVTFGDDVATRSVEDAASEGGWRSRALLFRIALSQPSAAARAGVIAKALELARRRGRFAAAARLYAPLIEEMPATPELVGFAGTAVRALLAAGRRPSVTPWLALCPPAGRDAGASLGGGGPVWPLLRLTDAHEDDPPAPGQLTAWLRQRSPQEPGPGRRQAALLFGLLDALGDKVRTEDWLAVMDGPTQVPTTIPQPALWHAQRIAAEELRSGETLLLALVSLGDDFPNRVEPTVLYRVVASLRLVGFDDEARALAVEAALAHGV